MAMTMAEIDEKLCEAMRIIADSTLSKMKYDQTYIMKVRDTKERANGRYTVSNDKMSFVAKVREENISSFYQKGDSVYVLIPQGDLNNDKIIIGKVANDLDSEYFVYRTPLAKMYDMVSVNNREDTEMNDFTIGRLKSFGNLNSKSRNSMDDPDAPIRDPNTLLVDLGYWMDPNGRTCSAFYDTFGFSVVAQTTDLGFGDVDYGIIFKVVYTDKTAATFTFDARKDMVGNVDNFVLPYQQEILFSNLNEKCITTIIATGYCKINNAEKFTDNTWNISFTNLKFYNGFAINSYSKDLIKLYSYGSNIYTLGTPTKRTVYLLWIEYNDQDKKWYYKSPPAETKISWSKSMVVINNTQSMNDETNWVSLARRTNNWSYSIPLNENQASTHVRAIVFHLNQDIIVDPIRFRVAAEGEDSDSEYEEPDDSIIFTFYKQSPDSTEWERDYGDYYLYNINNAIRDPKDVEIKRKIVATINGVSVAGEAYFNWTYPDSQNSMITVTSPESNQQDFLTYYIKDTYRQDLDNRILCRVLYKGQIYDGSIELSFGYPEFLSGGCTIQIDTIEPQDVTPQGSTCVVFENDYNIFYAYLKVLGKENANGQKNNYTSLISSITWSLGSAGGFPYGVVIIDKTPIGQPIQTSEGNAYQATIRVDRTQFNPENGLYISALVRFSDVDYSCYQSIPFTKEYGLRLAGPRYAQASNGVLNPENEQLNFALSQGSALGNYYFVFKKYPQQMKNGREFDTEDKYNFSNMHSGDVQVDVVSARYNSSMYYWIETFFFFKDREKNAITVASPTQSESSESQTLTNEEIQEQIQSLAEQLEALRQAAGLSG